MESIRPIIVNGKHVNIGRVIVTLHNGKVIKPMDHDIAPYIIQLNKMGVKTLYCCSGTDHDHTYREIAYIKISYTRDLYTILKKIAKELNFIIEQTVERRNEVIWLTFSKAKETFEAINAWKKNEETFYDQINEENMHYYQYERSMNIRNIIDKFQYTDEEKIDLWKKMCDDLALHLEK